MRLEGGNASATSVLHASLGAVANREDVVARDGEFRSAVSSHLAPSQHQQYQVAQKEPSFASTRHDLDAPRYVDAAHSWPAPAPSAPRETLRLEPHHAASAVAPPVAHCIRSRGRQELEPSSFDVAQC